MAEVMENCLTYALRTWRMGRPSDHLVIRRSHWGWFPHFAVVFEMENGDLEKREYVPTKPRPRNVPLEPKAKRIIDSMVGWDSVLVFGIAAQTLDALFRRYRDLAGLSGFTFHDSRHTAATWMAKRLDVLTLCKMFGWQNPKQAMVYYNPTASDIAKMLAGK